MINTFLSTLSITVAAYIIISVTIWFIKEQSCYRTTPLKDEDPFWERYSWAWIMDRIDYETRKFYAWSKFYDNLPENACPRLIYAAVYEMEKHSFEVENLNDLAYKKFLHS